MSAVLSAWLIQATTLLTVSKFVWTVLLTRNATDNHSDLSCWMENLPSNLHHVPLTTIAIPGSHDSCSYSISRTAVFSAGLDPKIKEIFEDMDTRSAKDIVYHWSVTQTHDVTGQLERGIRYLDMRAAYNHSDGEIYAVHGLTGLKLGEILEQVRAFVTNFTKEVILMDLNHFYSPPEDKILSTKLLFTKMQQYLGDFLCPRKNLADVSLQYLWRIKKQVLFFFDTSKPQAELPDYVWRTQDSIVSPFHEQISQDPEKWIKFLTKNYRSRRPKNKFYVTQGILQPHWIEILTGLAVNATLKTWLSETANAMLVKWIKKRRSGEAGINIVIADFIETYNFVPTVLSLNNAPRILATKGILLGLLVIKVFY